VHVGPREGGTREERMRRRGIGKKVTHLFVGWKKGGKGDAFLYFSSGFPSPLRKHQSGGSPRKKGSHQKSDGRLAQKKRISFPRREKAELCHPKSNGRTKNLKNPSITAKRKRKRGAFPNKGNDRTKKSSSTPREERLRNKSWSPEGRLLLNLLRKKKKGKRTQLLLRISTQNENYFVYRSEGEGGEKDFYFLQLRGRSP